MFGTNIIMIEIACFFDCVFENFFRTRSLRQLSHRDHFRSALDELLNFKANLAEIDAEILQDIGADARCLFHQAKQNMLGTDVLVVKALSLLICKSHYFSCAVG